MGEWGQISTVAVAFPSIQALAALVGKIVVQRQREWCQDGYYSNYTSASNRLLWIGSATFDQSVELSHFTGKITHHIDADIDQERDTLIHRLEQSRQLASIYQTTGVGATLQGHNGGGDRFYTDGELTVGILSVNNVVQQSAPTVKSNPPAVEIKQRVWSWLNHLLK